MCTYLQGFQEEKYLEERNKEFGTLFWHYGQIGKRCTKFMKDVQQFSSYFQPAQQIHVVLMRDTFASCHYCCNKFTKKFCNIGYKKRGDKKKKKKNILHVEVNSM